MKDFFENLNNTSNLSILKKYISEIEKKICAVEISAQS